MKATFFTLLSLFLLARTDLVAQATPATRNEHTADAEGRFDRPQPLAEGYDVRLDKIESKSSPGVIESYQLTLHHPSGTEDVMWRVPATEPDTEGKMEGASKPLRDLRILAAYASPEMAAVILWKNANDYWWVRWDVRKNELLPLIQRANRGDSDRYYFLDANTVEVMPRGSVYTIKADRDGNLTKNNLPWDRNYIVYVGTREIGHVAAEYGGGVFEREISGGWPFSSKSRRPPEVTEPSDRPAVVAPAATAPIQITPPAASQPPPTVAAQTPAVSSERSASAWPWLVGAILVVVLVIALALKRRV